MRLLGTSIRDMAADLGINSATLYAHYPSKAQILAALVQIGHEELHQRMQQALVDAGPEPADQLAALVRAQVLAHTDFPLLALVANQELHALTPEQAAPSLVLREQPRDLALRVLRRGVQRGAFTAGDITLRERVILTMQPLDIPVNGGLLRALRFGDGPRIVLAAHGITASAMSFRAVARHLPARWSLVALDLRGRGGSAGMPGPYGMSAHAADIVAAAEHLGSPLVLSGQSMGAYAALRAAVLRPELFTRLVLIDGGLPLPVPAGADPDQLLELTLGPALARLRQSFPDVEAYLDLFKAHPALAGDWNDDVAEYVRYDATGEPGAIRSRVNGEAVYADGRDLLVNAASFGDDLLTLAVPTVLLYAPRGMFGEEPGLLPQSIVDLWVARAPALRAELVEGTNHYTILMTDRAAKLIATRLTE